MTYNKLNGLSLNQAVLLRDALEIVEPDDQESIDDKDYLLRQIENIIDYHNEKEKHTNENTTRTVQ